MLTPIERRQEALSGGNVLQLRDKVDIELLAERFIQLAVIL
jgi:hypothetical protein